MRQTEPNPLPLFGDPVGPWHDWFAWFPVRTYDDQLCWLRLVRRRRIQAHHYLSGPCPSAWWQYHNEPEAA
jgi:hypothetical protein